MFLAFLLVVPGLDRGPWFELRGHAGSVALIPGMSIVLTLLSGFLVLAVWRGPFTTAKGWAVGGRHRRRRRLTFRVAIGGPPRAGQLRRLLQQAVRGLLDPRLLGADGGAVPGADRAGRDPGAIGKSIAFGGEKGFDVHNVPSADYLLKVVLALYIPYSLSSPFIGVFIDRFQRRKVLAWTNLVTAGVVAAVAVGVMLPLGKESSEGNVRATSR